MRPFPEETEDIALKEPAKKREPGGEASPFSGNKPRFFSFALRPLLKNA